MSATVHGSIKSTNKVDVTKEAIAIDKILKMVKGMDKAQKLRVLNYVQQVIYETD